MALSERGWRIGGPQLQHRDTLRSLHWNPVRVQTSCSTGKQLLNPSLTLGGRNFGFCDLLSKHRHARCVKGGSHHGLHWRILTLRCAQWLANCTHSHSSLLWLFWYWGEDHDRDQEVARRVKGLNSAKWTHWQRARSFRQGAEEWQEETHQLRFNPLGCWSRSTWLAAGGCHSN